MILFPACNPLAPVTPEDTYFRGITAVKSADADMFFSLISTADIKRIETAIRLFSSMDDSRLKKAGEHFGIDPERLKKLSVMDYIAYYLAAGPEINMIKKASAQKMITVDVSGTNAVIRFESGMFLRLVKEGPYWKLDIITL